VATDPRIHSLVQGRPPPAPEPLGDQEDRRVPAPRVARYLGITPRTLHRWLLDPDLGFPAPAYIKGRRYFLASDVVRWERDRERTAQVA